MKGTQMKRPIAILFLFSLALISTSNVRAKVTLHTIFTDNMVLQRDAELPVWGWAEPGEKITVAIIDNKAEATAGDDGKWMVRLKPMQVSDKPLQMEITGGQGEKAVRKNILVGETVVVSSDQVAKPAAVRFGWHQTAEPNLSNKEGLLASPFRTDK